MRARYIQALVRRDLGKPIASAEWVQIVVELRNHFPDTEAAAYVELAQRLLDDDDRDGAKRALAKARELSGAVLPTFVRAAMRCEVLDGNAGTAVTEGEAGLSTNANWTTRTIALWREVMSPKPKPGEVIPHSLLELGRAQGQLALALLTCDSSEGKSLKEEVEALAAMQKSVAASWWNPRLLAAGQAAIRVGDQRRD